MKKMVRSVVLIIMTLAIPIAAHAQSQVDMINHLLLEAVERVQKFVTTPASGNGTKITGIDDERNWDMRPIGPAIADFDVLKG